MFLFKNFEDEVADPTAPSADPVEGPVPPVTTEGDPTVPADPAV